jgi:ZIP family zinc transporter
MNSGGWLAVVALPLLAGLAMPFGAALALAEHIRPDWLENELRHAIIAFGGGALLSAVALVLVPEGVAQLPPAPVLLCVAAGALAFMALDMLLSALQNTASQLVAMLADFIPEALALGATLATGNRAGVLLTGLIALQNLPEGFNACRELRASTGLSGAQVLAAFVAMALLGPLAAVAGYLWLASYPAVVAGIMLFAAGGILYLLFQDIAPQARLQRTWAPPLGAVAGFLLGLSGDMLVHP